MFPMQLDTFAHCIHRKTSPNHAVSKMSLEYLNHNAVQRQHIVQRIPKLLCKDVHAMTPSYLADAQPATTELRDSEGIALRSGTQSDFGKPQ